MRVRSPFVLCLLSVLLLLVSAARVLIVPVGCVSKGRVKIHSTDGKDTWRDVVIGKSDGENVEIKQGLKEGELVLNKAGK